MMEELSEEIEAQLYAQVYHDNSSVDDESTRNFLNSIPLNMNKQLNSSKRYWKNAKTPQKPSNASFSSQDVAVTNARFANSSKTSKLSLEEVNNSSPAASKFVPYTSVLSFMKKPQPTPESSQTKEQPEISMPPLPPLSYEKKKNKTTKFPKKILNPLNVTARVLKSNNKIAMIEKLQIKKEKVRQVHNKKSKCAIETIEIPDSDESDCLPIEVAPPPLINLDSSDDEDEIAKKKRACSPSSSSIISDDFIASGEKKRIVTAFKATEVHTAAAKLHEIFRKKENFQADTSSASSSARSSIERNISKKASQKSDDNVEDSIYGAKLLKKSKHQQKSKTKTGESSDDDEDETPCVNVTNNKIRRKSQTGSGRKSTDLESDKEEDPKSKILANVRVKKRSRLITPRYNDVEFASMISTIVKNGELIEEDDSEVEKEAVKDCEVIENSEVEVITTDNERNNEILSDSDDSMKNVSMPANFDLSLNVTKSTFTPHEYIRNPNKSTELIAAINVANFDSEIGWNDEMKYFYDGSWGGEHFTLTEQFNKMSRNPNDWKIIQADRMRISDAANKIRCRNCNEIGHIAIRCTQQKKRVICFMCGEEGHRETRCPNSICLRCGKPNKMFSTVCANCHKLNKRFCPLCNYQGHDIDSCPDKWRRYHSTTSESMELVSQYKTNDRQYCSICARRGHFAEGCAQFLKTTSGLITSSPIRIISHKPSYPKNITTFNDDSSSNRQLLALFSYFPSYKFNFQFNSRAQIYQRFLEHFMKYKELQTITGATNVGEKAKKVKKRKRKAERKVTENTQVVVEEDSNYSFSDFFSSTPQQKSDTTGNDGSEMSQDRNYVRNPFSSADKLADFIPFNNENEPEKIEEEISTAKMMLTKEHFGMLNCEKGRKVLQELQQTRNVSAAFSWDNTGNSLNIRGTASNQSLFHADIREFLYKFEMEKYERLMEISSQLPKSKQNLVRHLKENLNSMNKLNVPAAKKMLESMLTAEQTLNHKKALKCRKSLNVAFVGCAKLCDGDRHLGVLQRILFALEEDLSQGNFDVSNEIREEIRQHMKPIFGTHDHGDYRKLFFKFKNLKKGKHLPNPIAMK